MNGADVGGGVTRARGGRPAVSVLLPVRNGADTIARAVTSTLRALPAEGVVLVHDDGSTDATPAVLAGIGDPRLQVVRSNPARGVARGLNLLLERVATPLVARMDADDVCLPWRFRAQLATLRRGADVVWSTVVGIGDVPGGVRPAPPLPISAAAMPLHMLLSNPVAHSTMVARTSVLTAAGGYRAVAAEDYELWLRLCSQGARCVRVGLPTLLYRFHAGQVTASSAWTVRAWSDPVLRDSYSALARSVLGLEPTWFADLPAAAERGAGALDRLRVLADAVECRAAVLPPLQRVAVQRKVAVLRRSVAAGA